MQLFFNRQTRGNCTSAFKNMGLGESITHIKVKTKFSLLKNLNSQLQVHVGLLNEAVLELKGLLHGFLRRRDVTHRDECNDDDVTDRNHSDEERLNLVKLIFIK